MGRWNNSRRTSSMASGALVPSGTRKNVRRATGCNKRAGHEVHRGIRTRRRSLARVLQLGSPGSSTETGFPPACGLWTLGLPLFCGSGERASSLFRKQIGAVTQPGVILPLRVKVVPKSCKPRRTRDGEMVASRARHVGSNPTRGLSWEPVIVNLVGG